jgi:hypothetical protein
MRETMRDLRADWGRWSVAERVLAVTLAALLAVVPVLIAATVGVS